MIQNPLPARILITLSHIGPRWLFRLCCVILSSDIGYFDLRGVRLPHPYGLVIHQNTKIGTGVTIMQHVTLGSRRGGEDAPRLRDGAYIGAGACVLGAIEIGASARIGANSVVIFDVPGGATVVGVPGRVRLSESSTPGKG